MTLDEAIKHCLEVAEHNDNLIRWGCINESVTHNCRECAAEHRKLAEWLRELKELRNSIGAVKLQDMKGALKLIREYKTEIAERRATAKRGHWEEIEDYDGDVHYRCTNCKTEFYLESGSPEENEYFFCPHCGADMREGE